MDIQKAQLRHCKPVQNTVLQLGYHFNSSFLNERAFVLFFDLSFHIYNLVKML